MTPHCVICGAPVPADMMHVHFHDEAGGHRMDPSCWCGPLLEYEDPITRGQVWLHRRANDAAHYAFLRDEGEKPAYTVETATGTSTPRLP